MQRWLDFLRTDDIPPLARPNYAYELRHIALWAVVLGAIEGEGASVVARKTFDASNLLVTIVWLIPNAVYLLNVVWGVLLRGRPRIRSYFAVAGAAVAALASVCFTPDDKFWGGWLFALQLALVNFFASGLVILRTTLWRANYPVTHRARITGRITMVRMLVTLLTVAALATLFDWRADLYPYVYLAVAALGGLSLIPLANLSVRGERAELRRTRALAAARPAGAAHGGIIGGLREMAAILRRDRVFASYMVGQFLIGSSHFFTGPLINMKVAGDLGFGYLASAAILSLPTVFQMLTLRWWGPFYDRVGLLRFRVINTLFWTITVSMLSLSMLLLSVQDHLLATIGLVVLIAARILHGACTGGGAIAWNLGHLQYAPEHQTELYMAVHMGLTGLRGLVMPVLGFLAYQWLGWGAFLIALALAITAHFVFRWVEKLEARLTTAAQEAEEELAAERVGATET